MKCTENFKIDMHRCDVSGNMRASELMKIMQECSTKDLAESNISQKSLVESGKTYVLCRLNMSIYRSPRLYDEVEVATWACESSGVALTRCYQARINGVIVAEATTVWGIIDIKTRHLCRISALSPDFTPDEPMLELDSPSRIHIPQDLDLKLVGERTVSYRDIDSNGHMNNTNYPDLYCDFIPEMSSKKVIMMGINYVSEAKAGEVLKVYMTESDGQYYIRTVKPDRSVNSEAIIMTENN